MLAVPHPRYRFGWNASGRSGLAKRSLVDCKPARSSTTTMPISETAVVGSQICLSDTQYHTVTSCLSADRPYQSRKARQNCSQTHEQRSIHDNHKRLHDRRIVPRLFLHWKSSYRAKLLANSETLLRLGHALLMLSACMASTRLPLWPSESAPSLLQGVKKGSHLGKKDRSTS